MNKIEKQCLPLYWPGFKDNIVNQTLNLCMKGHLKLRLQSQGKEGACTVQKKQENRRIERRLLNSIFDFN